MARHNDLNGTFEIDLNRFVGSAGTAGMSGTTGWRNIENDGHAWSIGPTTITYSPSSSVVTSGAITGTTVFTDGVTQVYDGYNWNQILNDGLYSFITQNQFQELMSLILKCMEQGIPMKIIADICEEMKKNYDTDSIIKQLKDFLNEREYSLDDFVDDLQTCKFEI